MGVLGGQDFILSQASGVEEELFKGKGKLGVMADVASLDFRERQGVVRDLGAAQASSREGLLVPERFVDRLALHIARNFLLGASGTGPRVPLILGVWGAKGCGKTFNVELAAARMGVRVVSLSAGELEDERAGGVAKRIRDRYRAASDCIMNENQPAMLVISDIDAGLGRMRGTQATVNTQNATAELMAICDDPSRVQGGPKGKRTARVPIVVTANDLSRVYAPLLRDGRMDKFYWEPTLDEKAAMLAATGALDRAGAENLVRAYPSQALDFFAAARARTVDTAVRALIAREGGLEAVGASLMASYDWRRGCSGCELPGDLLDVSAEAMAAACGALSAEQDNVNAHNLAREYFANLESEEQGMKLQAEAAERAAQRQQRELAEAHREARAAEVSAARKDAQVAREMLHAISWEVRQEPATDDEGKAVPWERVDADGARERMYSGWLLVDMRDVKSFDRESYKEAVNCPACTVSGFGTGRIVSERIDGFVEDLGALVAERDAAGAVVMGDGDGDAALSESAAAAAHAVGTVKIAEMVGGFTLWNKIFGPHGKRRMGLAWQLPGGEDYWTASN